MTATEAAVREVQRLVVLLRWPACDAYDADRLGRLTQLYWLYSETRSEGVRQSAKLMRWTSGFKPIWTSREEESEKLKSRSLQSGKNRASKRD